MLLVAYVGLGALSLVAFAVAAASQGLRRARTQVARAWATIDGILRHRDDLIARMESIVQEIPPAKAWLLGINPEFVELDVRLSGAEDRLQLARADYETALRQYVARRAQWPAWLLDRVGAFPPRAELELDDERLQPALTPVPGQPLSGRGQPAPLEPLEDAGAFEGFERQHDAAEVVPE